MTYIQEAQRGPRPVAQPGSQDISGKGLGQNISIPLPEVDSSNTGQGKPRIRVIRKPLPTFSLPGRSRLEGGRQLSVF